MPRLTTTERVERARDAIALAVEAIEGDLARRDYDSAWIAADTLSDVLDAARTSNSRLRSLTVASLMKRERYRLREIAERYGVSVSWVAKLSAGAKDAEVIPTGEPTTEPGQ